MQRTPPELKRVYDAYDRKVANALRKDRPKLFRALAEFVNMRGDSEGWVHFRHRWPSFFPEHDYSALENTSGPTIFEYPYWLEQIWRGGESEPYLEIMLGARPTPKVEDLLPEEVAAARLSSIPPKEFALDWTTGSIRYQGGCDFQRALYLLFQESWRARFCEKCGAAYIANREGQKYCSTDCSEEMQREVKRKWWTEHGKEWRDAKNKAEAKKKGSKGGTKKTR